MGRVVKERWVQFSEEEEEGAERWFTAKESNTFTVQGFNVI